MPLSDFVGLTFVTVIASPSRMLPPTNSLPPLRCPRPAGRFGANRGEFGAEGDCGGLRNTLSNPGVGGREAAGLNEKAGRAGDREGPFPSSAPDCETSMADRGRLPVAREKEEGAEEDEGRAGKTNGGFGGGGFDRGDAWEPAGRVRGAARSLMPGVPGS
jgi:hypothetical protein